LGTVKIVCIEEIYGVVNYPSTKGGPVKTIYMYWYSYYWIVEKWAIDLISGVSRAMVLKSVSYCCPSLRFQHWNKGGVNITAMKLRTDEF
jgi:hypothetical protein